MDIPVVSFDPNVRDWIIKHKPKAEIVIKNSEARKDGTHVEAVTRKIIYKNRRKSEDDINIR
jgi:hypothetical protein